MNRVASDIRYAFRQMRRARCNLDLRCDRRPLHPISLAAWLPARRATSIEPMQALRTE